MNDLFIVLSVSDGIDHVDNIDVPDKQKRIRALRDWIKENGEDGVVYRLAKFVTESVRAEETKVMQPVDLPLNVAPAEPKAKKAKKPEAVEA